MCSGATRLGLAEPLARGELRSLRDPSEPADEDILVVWTGFAFRSYSTPILNDYPPGSEESARMTDYQTPVHPGMVRDRAVGWGAPERDPEQVPSDARSTPHNVHLVPAGRKGSPISRIAIHRNGPASTSHHGPHDEFPAAVGCARRTITLARGDTIRFQDGEVVAPHRIRRQLQRFWRRSGWIAGRNTELRALRNQCLIEGGRAVLIQPFA
jgi:hypothetical protein